jgi:hypothetical protein
MNQSLKRICKTIHSYLFFSKFSQNWFQERLTVVEMEFTEFKVLLIHKKRQIEMQTSDLL